MNLNNPIDQFLFQTVLIKSSLTDEAASKVGHDSKLGTGFIFQFEPVQYL